MISAQSRDIPRKWKEWDVLGLWNTEESQYPSAMTGSNSDKQERDDLTDSIGEDKR